MPNETLEYFIDKIPHEIGSLVGSIPPLLIDLLPDKDINHLALDGGLGASIYAGLSGKHAMSALYALISLGPDLHKILIDSPVVDSSDLGNLPEKLLGYGATYIAALTLRYFINKNSEPGEEADEL